MANNAQSHNIAGVEHSASVVFYGDTVMDVQGATVGEIRNGVSARAAIVVPLQDCKSERGVSLVAALAPRFDAEFSGESTEVEILREPVRMHVGIEVPVFSAPLALSAHRCVTSRSHKTLVPRFATKLLFANIGMMAAFVFGNAQAASAVFVDGERKETLFASALAYHRNAGSLSFGNCHSSMLPHAGKIEKSVNCGDALPETGVIRSQAAQECAEGSTTRAWSPERTVKPHERTPRKGRDSLDCVVIRRSIGLNADAITIRPYSGKLEALSKFEVRKPVMQALKNDAKKVFDRAAYAQFYLTPLRVVPTGGTSTTSLNLTTNGTATATNSIAYGNYHAKLVVDTMKERNIPPYVGDDYMSIAWPTTLRTFKNNLEAIHTYTVPGIQLIFNAEIGRYENVRYTEQTNVSKGISSTGVNGTAWANGLSDWIFFFGEDTVVEGVATPEEVRAKIPTDYGRSKGIAYYYIGGFGIVHTNAVQARIVMWDSAG